VLNRNIRDARHFGAHRYYNEAGSAGGLFRKNAAFSPGTTEDIRLTTNNFICPSNPHWKQGEDGLTLQLRAAPANSNAYAFKIALQDKP
jgi:hypothetical protein